MADQEAPRVKKDVVPSQYRETYKASGGTCGDFIGKRLQEVGKDGLPALKTVMKENSIPEARWAGANVGMVRMNLANVLRSTFLNGGDIYILGKQYNVQHMLDDYNGKIERDKPETIRKFADVHELQTNELTVKRLTKTFFEAADKARAEEEKAKAKAVKDEEKAKKAADKEKAKADKEAKAAADAADKAKAKADKDAAAKEAKTAKAAAAKEAKKAPAKQTENA